MIESKHLPREITFKTLQGRKLNRGGADAIQRRKEQLCRRLAADLNGLRQATAPLEEVIERERKAIIRISLQAAQEANRSYGQAIAHAVSALIGLLNPFTRRGTAAKIITDADKIILALIDLFQSGSELGEANRVLRRAAERVRGHKITIGVFANRLNRIQRDIKRISADQRRIGCPT